LGAALVVAFIACSGNSNSQSTCTQGGGQCTGVGECGKGAGFLSGLACGQGASIVCCMDSCGGAEDFQCCTGKTTFRPVCNGGQLGCESGTRCNQADGGSDAGTDGGTDGGSDGGADAGPCAAAGGVCTGVGSCGPGVGFIGNVSCSGAGNVCCMNSCGGPEDFTCCTASATFRPSCVSGHLACTAGTPCGNADAGYCNEAGRGWFRADDGGSLTALAGLCATTNCAIGCSCTKPSATVTCQCTGALPPDGGRTCISPTCGLISCGAGCSCADAGASLCSCP
jgi:hypothetical protein